MAITGECPQCGDDQAQFLTIDKTANVAVDCSGVDGCNYQGATTLQNALALIPDDNFPLRLE